MNEECDHAAEFEERDREFDELSEAADKLQDQLDDMEDQRDKLHAALELIYEKANEVL